MGLEVAAIAMAVVAVGGEIGKGAFQIAGASEKEKALDLQGKELEIQNQQKTLANYETMEKVLDAQIAHMTTTGLAFSSPSFNAIERNTLNIGAKKQRNTDTEYEISKENLEIEKRNVKNTLYAQLFGDVVEGASAAFSVAAKAPKMPTSGAA